MALSIEILEGLIDPILETLDMQLYHVEWTVQAKEKCLVVVIDRLDKSDGGITLTELTTANREISAMLDLEDPVQGRYRLIVESPGIERPLQTPRHYRLAHGERVKLTMRKSADGASVLEGKLLDSDESHIIISVEGVETNVPLKDIKAAQTIYVWPKKQSQKR